MVPRTGKSIEIEESSGYQRWGQGEDGEFLFNQYKVIVWEDKHVLQMDGGDGCPICKRT